MFSPYLQSSMGHAKAYEEFFLDSMGRPRTDMRDSLAEAIMLAKHYIEKDGMKDHDIHNEFTDFIIRLALEHKATGKPSQAFIVDLLPDFDDKMMGMVCFTDNAGKKQRVDVNKLGDKKKNFFRDLYLNLRAGTPFVVDGKDIQALAPQNFDTASVGCGNGFHINVGKLILQRIDSYKNMKVSNEPPVTYSTLRAESANMWYKDEKNNYYIKDIEAGGWAKYNPGKDNMSAENKCYGTGVNGVDVEQCNEYVLNCLVKNDAASLEECLKKFAGAKDFFEAAKKEILSIHPLLAYRTLQRFGFRSRNGESGLKEVEDVYSWLDGVVKEKIATGGSTQTYWDAIQKNQALVDYLNLVSQYVNANPGILNQAYEGAPISMKVRQSDYAKRLGLKPRIIVSKDQMMGLQLGSLGQQFKIKSATQGQSPFILAGKAMYPPAFGMSPSLGFITSSASLGGLFGGGGGKCEATVRLIGQNPCGSKIIGSLLNDVIDMLSQKGKVLAKDSQDKIRQNIEQLSKLETDLVKTHCILDEYNKMINVFGENEIITVEHIAKLSKRSDSILDKTGCLEQKLASYLEKMACDGDSLTPL